MSNEKAVPLLPCPFCGGAAEMDTRQPYYMARGQIGMRVAIYCTNNDPACFADMGLCYADVPDMGAEEMVATVSGAWNRRAVVVPAADAGEVTWIPEYFVSRADGAIRVMRHVGHTPFEVARCENESYAEGIAGAMNEAAKSRALLSQAQGQKGEVAQWQWREYHTDNDDPGWGTWEPLAVDLVERFKKRKNTEVRPLYDSPSPDQRQVREDTQGLADAGRLPPSPASEPNPGLIREREKLRTVVADVARTLKAAALPDPHDERDISSDWLCRMMRKQADRLDAAMQQPSAAEGKDRG